MIRDIVWQILYLIILLWVVIGNQDTNVYCQNQDLRNRFASDVEDVSIIYRILSPLPALVYLGFLCHFQHCTGHITTGSWKGRRNQYIEFVSVLYCKLLTNGKQLPAFLLEAVMGIKPRPQRWEALPVLDVLV